jgi:hypothetical protein
MRPFPNGRHLYFSPIFGIVVIMIMMIEKLVEWFWQGKPKYSEKTCPDATLSTRPGREPGPPRWEASD